MSAATDPRAEAATLEPLLMEVVEHLAKIERAPGSPGEAQAADWLAGRLREAGCRVDVEPAEFYDGYARLVGSLEATTVLSGLIASRRRGRRLGGGLAALAGLALADDISNGPRVLRRRTAPRPTQNVVAVCGDEAAERTLVVLAHHDAAPTGLIFDDRLQSWAGERFPGVLERIDTSLPLWWLALAAPTAVAAGAALGRRGLVRFGTTLATVVAAATADIARSPTVPGANDNLSSVAVQVALAERFAQEPIEGLRVMLVSCGAEEVIQGGIYDFAARHFPRLDRDRTWFVSLECVGSPRLILVEGEGPVIMEDYFDRPFRDLIGHLALDLGITLRRGMRARNSTDAVIPNRAGYPTATLAAINRYKAIPHYHQMSDTPDKLHPDTMAQATQLVEALARRLAHG